MLNRNIERIIELYNRIHGISGGHHHSLSSTTVFFKPLSTHLDDLIDHACKLITCMRGLYFKRSSNGKSKAQR